jgi:hypothetical protein
LIWIKAAQSAAGHAPRHPPILAGRVLMGVRIMFSVEADFLPIVMAGHRSGRRKTGLVSPGHETGLRKS